MSILLRCSLALGAAALFWAVPASAETLNHLDCRFNALTSVIDCPAMPPGASVQAGRASTVAPPVEGDGKVETTQHGSSEWAAACAAKFKSFDARTGLYKSHSGVMRECKI